MEGWGRNPPPSNMAKEYVFVFDHGMYRPAYPNEIVLFYVKRGWEWLCKIFVRDKRHFVKTPKLARGRGHWSQVAFDRPDPLREVSKQARMMEEAGQLKNPKVRAMVDFKLRKLREQEPFRKKVDYQKNSGAEHPLGR